MPHRLAPLAVAAALALGSVVAAAAPASAATDCVTVTVSSNHHLHLQTHLRAGVVRFDVRGPKQENIQLARPKHGAGPAKLASDGNELNSGKATDLEHDFAALGGAGGGHDLWFRLAPGTYYALDTNEQTATADEVVTLHVSGDVHRGRMPHRSGTITAVHEMSWAKRPARIPASGVLGFTNASSDYHFIDLERLKSSTTTLAEVKQALKKNDPSLFDMKWSYDTGVLSPHHSQASSYHLKRGTYAVLCWWPGDNGVPHALMGMVRLIRVG